MPKNPKADDPKAENPKAEKPKAEKAKAEKPKGEKAKADKTKADKEEKSGLVAAAEAVGATAGKVAALVGATAEPLHTPSQKKPKLAPKHKHRLPRRQKKAQRKLEAAKALGPSHDM